jgi:cytochrome oxidase Cu insertion factor (SCO1/SenC/PrrC family)
MYMHSLSKAVLSVVLGSISIASLAQDKKPVQPMPAVKVGDVAPDFKLTDQDGKDISLSQFRGKKNVALAFYVFAFTGG